MLCREQAGPLDQGPCQHKLSCQTLQRIPSESILRASPTATIVHAVVQAQDARFTNACVSFDAATLRPKYELLWGSTGRSNALAVAEGLRFDPLVLQQARDIASGRSQGASASPKTRAVMQVPP